MAEARPIVLVTGASRGVGRGIAVALARAGWAVAISGRDRVALAETASLVIPTGGACMEVILDVTDSQDVERAIGDIEGTFGPIAALVNNAGIQRLGDALDFTDDDWANVMDTDLMGPYRCSRAVGLRMRGRGAGAIVNVASVAGIVPSPGRLPYSIAKAGLLMMTRVLALELSDDGIRVNAVAPTFVDTDLGRLTLDRPGARESIEAAIPLHRLATIDDVSNAVRFLVDPASSFLTGVVLPVDGGVSLR